MFMLKATGIVRRVDELGRIVIPKEIRKTMGVESGDAVEFFVEGDRIILRKYTPGCNYCSSVENLMQFKGTLICNTCISEISEKHFEI